MSLVGSLSVVLLLASGLGVKAPSTSAAERESTANSVEYTTAFWEDRARERFHQSAQYFPATPKRARNVILFLGDGMGIPTISAGRLFKSERRGRLGGAIPTLEFENWPFHTMCRTYDLQAAVTDSAASATAYLGGTKTRSRILGLTGAVAHTPCRQHRPEEQVESVLEAARAAGMATGIVTTSRVTHASPAGAFAHVASRHWESDSRVMRDCEEAEEPPMDIARQLVEANADINVVLGGGARNFLPRGRLGERADGRNLAEEWLANQTRRGRRAVLLTRAHDFLRTDFSRVDYVFGLLNTSHMSYDCDRGKDEPSLANMTTTAIKILSRQPTGGFFLFVEGARIDHAHHENRAKKALWDLLAFEDAIREGTRMVDLEETLVIVTADHSHSLALAGEATRTRSIFDVDSGLKPETLDKRGMLPLVYATGPSAVVDAPRVNLTALSSATLHDVEFTQPAFIPLPWASHGGEDVGVYAIGVFSHLFHSTVDNTFIAHAIKYALCLPPFMDAPHCPACRLAPVLPSLVLLLFFSNSGLSRLLFL